MLLGHRYVVLCGRKYTPLVLARLSENALVQWYGAFENENDKYVPMSCLEWEREFNTTERCEHTLLSDDKRLGRGRCRHTRSIRNDQKTSFRRYLSL